jgi:nickel-dependent lactate racemase
MFENIRLSYGDGSIELRIPEKNFAGFYSPRKLASTADNKSILENSLDNSIGERLEDICRDKKVCVLLEDSTRSAPYEDMINSVVKRLLKSKKVYFMISTGSHSVETEGNRKIIDCARKVCERENLKNFETMIHDCRHSKYVNYGKTSRGTEVLVNAISKEIDVFVVLSDMKPHYFAGYSNPLKNFLPGICMFKTIEQNHSLSLEKDSVFGLHPFHPDERRRDNPIACDMLEAMRMITKGRKVFVLNTVFSKGKILFSNAGEIEAAVRECIEKIDELTGFRVKPSKYVIVSPGGYPDDGSLYQGQKGLDLTKNSVLPGGEMLLIAECREGITYDEKTTEFFYEPMKDLEKILAMRKSDYKLYTHKAYKFAELIKKTKVIYVYSCFDPKSFEAIHLKPVRNPQEVIDQWIKKDPEAKILVFEGANKLAVYSE